MIAAVCASRSRPRRRTTTATHNTNQTFAVNRVAIGCNFQNVAFSQTVLPSTVSASVEVPR